MQKKILFISRKAPYGSSTAREALDAVLAAAAYDLNPGLLFMDDGVFQLLRHQESGEIEQKNFAAMLPILPLYDVENIFAHLESLQARNIESNDLILDNIQIIDNQTVSALLAQHDQLLSF